MGSMIQANRTAAKQLVSAGLHGPPRGTLAQGYLRDSPKNTAESVPSCEDVLDLRLSCFKYQWVILARTRTTAKRSLRLSREN